MPLGTVTKTEVPHNTPEQVREYLQAALELVDELAVPDDLRAAALAAAVTLLSVKQVFFEQVPSGIVDLGASRH